MYLDNDDTHARNMVIIMHSCNRTFSRGAADRLTSNDIANQRPQTNWI